MVKKDQVKFNGSFDFHYISLHLLRCGSFLKEISRVKEIESSSLCYFCYLCVMFQLFVSKSVLLLPWVLT